MSDNTGVTDADHVPERLTCKNCDTRFSGKFCPNCGQSVKEIQQPISFLIIDFVGTMMAFDARLFKTLAAVLLKPGQLTADFLAGKRARYMPPFRFYVFISFVMFLLISNITSSSIKESGYRSDDLVDVADMDPQALADSIKNSTDSVYVSIRMELDGVSDSLDVAQETIPGMEGIRKGFETVKKSITDDDDIAGNSVMERRIKKIMNYPELYMNKLYQYLSWALFILMPLFACLLWLAFRRSQSLYIGHLIFSINIHSFLFTIITLMIVINMIFPGNTSHWEGHLLWLVPIYQIVGARILYNRSWIRSTLKMMGVWFLYNFFLLIGTLTVASFAFFDM
ncbi:DUF3667 domain-containing protein [Marinilabiliaceae bacterium JC017]|nr:DUF3667 domain-containing protein [Marinilabiliaceae bacterium JC017]